MSELGKDEKTKAHKEIAYEAIANSSKRLKTQPDDHSDWLMRGLAYILLGDQNKAIHDLRKAVQLSQQNNATASCQIAQNMLRSLEAKQKNNS